MIKVVKERRNFQQVYAENKKKAPNGHATDNHFKQWFKWKRQQQAIEKSTRNRKHVQRKRIQTIQVAHKGEIPDAQ